MFTQELREEPRILQGDLSPNRSRKTRSAIKFDFALREKEQANSYIADLENNLQINKTIIAELIGKVPSGQGKKVMELLNSENANLHSQIKKLIGERNEIQGKLLISEQIIQNMKKHEQETVKDLLNRQKELADQLNRKEFVLQKIERRYDKAIDMLNTMTKKNQDAKGALKNLKADRRSEFKLTNIVEENERLSNELKKERELTTYLTTQLDATKNRSFITESKSTTSKHIDNTYYNLRAKNPIELRARNRSEMGMMKKSRMDEVSELSRRVMELYRINVALSDALKEANRRLGNSREKGLHARSRNQKSHNHHTDEIYGRRRDVLEESEQGVNNTKSSFKKEE